MAQDRIPIDTPNPSAARIISKLHEALSSKQRLAVTSTLLVRLQSKEHVSSLFFDDLLRAGITNTLCLQLGLVFSRPELAKTEIENICLILNLIFARCTASVRDNSASDAWLELFQFLVLALRWGVVLPVISILQVCAESLLGSTFLFKCRLVRSIASVCPCSGYRDAVTSTALLGLMKNLSNCGEDHCLEIVEQTTLMLHLAGIPFMTGGCQKTMIERLSAIIRNLAVSPSTRLLLAHHSNVFGAVARMGGTTNRHVQRNILSFLLSLSQDMDSCVTIALHGDGLIVNLLRQLLMIENNTHTRRRAVRVVRLMAREAAGSQIARDSVLIASLSQRSLRDRSNEVRAEATDALARLSLFVHAQVSRHHVLPLMQLASFPSLPEVFSRALIQHSAQLISRLPIGERRTFIECLAQISMSASSSNECKELACCAILDLSKEESNRVIIASASILEALVRNATGRGRAQLQRPSVGIKAIVFLATMTHNRKRMAVHRRLMQTLILYATSTEDDRTKKDVKKVIVVLLSEL